MQRKAHLDPLAISLLLACCVFWGFQQVLLKTTVGEIPPIWQASLRFAGASVVLFLWCRWRGIALFGSDGTTRSGLLAGCLFAAEFAFLYLSLTYTTASRATVFLYTAPFVVALLLPRIVPTERLRTWQWVGLLLAFAAVALAFSEGFGAGASKSHLVGDALAWLAGIFWGLTTLVLRGSRLGGVSAEKALFYQVAFTALALPWVSLALGEPWSLSYSGAAWASLLVQTVVGAFASYLAWMWMLRHYPATQLSSFTFLTPVFALLFGVVLLQEPLTLNLLVALVGVAAGIVLVNRKG